MDSCLFCKILTGEVPSTVVFENEHVYAFRDIDPQAPIHILVIPREHVASLADITSENSSDAARCLEAIPDIAKAVGLINGFRVISNSGPDAGQTVPHLHFHILGGRPLGEGLVNK